MNDIILTQNYVRNSITDNYRLSRNNTISDSTNYIPAKNVMSKTLEGGSKIEKDINMVRFNDVKDMNKYTRISRINIDSRHRNKESKNILDSKIFYLENNPIDIVSNTINDTDIVIHHKNHPFSVNDNIIMQGVKSKKITLDDGITFMAGSSYAKINHINHGINFDTINAMNIDINNFIGNLNNNTDYNNIPINQINGLQKIYATATASEITNNNYYYIYMGSIIASKTETYNLSSLEITFKDINGVNLNLLNANYPVNIDQLNGYQTIYYVEPDLYKIKLNLNNNISIYSCGGDSIWIGSILDFIEGYINNNFYKISLKKTFYNVSKIKLISTEFPNTEKVIKAIPSKKQNNMFYWKLQSDGDKLYSISFPSGNYSINLLETTMKILIEAVKRDTLTITNQNITTYSYYEYNKCTITLEPRTDTFSIQFLTTIFIPKAITFRSASSYSDNTARFIINHPNHRLVENIIITIINATYTDGVPQDVINNSFSIERVIDENTYEIKLPKYNISSSDLSVTNGGSSMGITFPVKSQLLFNYLDTIGNLIGFRNVGEPNSITNFNYLCSNTDLYQYDSIDSGNTYTNNSINLSGDNYILMTSPIFKEVYNSGLIDNIFSKILLAGEPGSILYNQFIQLGESFTTPIASFSEWEVSFYDASGDLYNFGNLEHSYTLEIYEEIDKL